MTRRTETKSAAAPFAPAAASSEPSFDEQVEQHEWAGDLIIDSNEVTDPSMAFAVFQGAEGETAWLDRADDGTITCWVRDADDSVYRYSDPEAWAVDVDDSGMSRMNDPGAAADPAMTDDDSTTDEIDAELPADGDDMADPADPELDPDEDGTDPTSPTDPTDPDAPLDDDLTDPSMVDESAEDPTAVDEAIDTADADAQLDPDEDPDEDEDDAKLPFGRRQGKSYQLIAGRK